MRRTISFARSRVGFVLSLALVLSACSPLDLPSTETAMPVTEVVGTLTPTLTPEEQAALDAALAYVGDKVLNLQLAYIINIGANEYRVTFNQVYQNIPVYSGVVSVFVANGSASSSESYYTDIQLDSLIPTTAPETAVATAVQSIGIPNAYTLKIAPSLIIYPTALAGQISRIYVLAWQFVITTDCPIGEWNVVVNAEDGTMLEQANIMESTKPLESECSTPLPLPTVTPAPSVTPIPTPLPTGYPPPETTEAPATPTLEPYPRPENSVTQDATLATVVNP